MILHWNDTFQQVVAYRGLIAPVHLIAAAALCQAKQGAHAYELHRHDTLLGLDFQRLPWTSEERLVV